MEHEKSNITNKFTSLDSEMEIFDTKLKGLTIFNDSPNLCQNVTLSNTDLFKKLGKCQEPIPSPKFLIQNWNDPSLDSVSTDATFTNKMASAIGLSLLPEQRESICRKNGGCFSLMIVGLPGSGKTTFINTLFGTDLINLGQKEDIAHTPKLAVHRLEVIEEGFSLKLNVIDTPGFGGSIDNLYAWVPATKYLDDQFKLHLFQEEQPVRKSRFNNRVHCCLYFIICNGKGLNQLDITTMKELSKRVNLIPVISKSDAFNIDDLNNFKLLVRQTLALHNITICDHILDQNVKDQIHAYMPFAVIGSNEYHENSEGQIIRGRKYNWGIAEVENPMHCDFIYLREILMSKNMLDLILSTDTYHESFRSNYLGERFKKVVKEQSISEILIQKMDGLEQLIYFHQRMMASSDETMNEEGPILLDKQIKLKEKFAGIIANQERRFKDWKKALIEKQNVFNNDIEKLHDKIIKLQDLIAHLEGGYIIYDESDCESIESNDETTKSEKKGIKTAFIN